MLSIRLLFINIILIYFIFRMKFVQSLCLIDSSGLFTGLLQVSRGICFIFVGSIAYITELICYLCKYENRMRFGIVKSEIKFPFVSALTLHYLCIPNGTYAETFIQYSRGNHHGIAGRLLSYEVHTRRRIYAGKRFCEVDG